MEGGEHRATETELAPSLKQFLEDQVVGTFTSLSSREKRERAHLLKEQDLDKCI